MCSFTVCQLVRVSSKKVYLENRFLSIYNFKDLCSNKNHDRFFFLFDDPGSLSGPPVVQMAPQIVLPTGQMQSLKEELELAAEHFFEDAWRRNNRYQSGPETEMILEEDESISDASPDRFVICALW